jgi:hypothetical protein
LPNIIILFFHITLLISRPLRSLFY